MPGEEINQLIGFPACPCIGISTLNMCHASAAYSIFLIQQEFNCKIYIVLANGSLHRALFDEDWNVFFSAPVYVLDRSNPAWQFVWLTVR